MRRKALIIWITLFVLANAIRLWHSIQHMIDTPNLPTYQPPVYLTVTSLFWLLLFFVCGVGVWRKKFAFFRVMMVGMLIYQLQHVADRLIFSRSAGAYQTFGALIITSIIALVITLLLTSKVGFKIS
jgi:hypothetical protein